MRRRHYQCLKWFSPEKEYQLPAFHKTPWGWARCSMRWQWKSVHHFYQEFVHLSCISQTIFSFLNCSNTLKQKPTELLLPQPPSHRETNPQPFPSPGVQAMQRQQELVGNHSAVIWTFSCSHQVWKHQAPWAEQGMRELREPLCSSHDQLPPSLPPQPPCFFQMLCTSPFLLPGVFSTSMLKISVCPRVPACF